MNIRIYQINTVKDGKKINLKALIRQLSMLEKLILKFIRRFLEVRLIVKPLKMCLRNSMTARFLAFLDTQCRFQM